jgi:hypothetical protein
VSRVELWRDIPGWSGSYQISNRGRVKSLQRIIVRRNNVPCTVSERVLRQKRHPRTGLLTVTLAHAGRHRTAHVHKLVDDVFGDVAQMVGGPDNG